MGLLDKLRGELIDIIEWIDDSRHTLVWRFARYQNEIKHGASLIVRPGQVAVFVQSGRIADCFEPGTYRLTTRNLPVLASVMGWARGFNSPFRAEVYFVSTRQATELKWGTPNPVILRDPDFGPIRLRAFGTYALQADDPAAIVRELVGTDGRFESDELYHLVRSTITSTFADVVASSRIPALDMAAHYQELAEEVRQEVIERLGRDYGLQVTALFILNISFPPDVEKALDRRTSMELIGNMSVYQQYQMGSAMMAAAENPAEGGGANTGLGLGVGLSMAQQMTGPGMHSGTSMPFGQTGLRPPPLPLAPPPIPWFLAAGSQTWGPVSEQTLLAWISEGRLPKGALVWTPGLPDWTPIERVGALAQNVILTPPPLPASDSKRIAGKKKSSKSSSSPDVPKGKKTKASRKKKATSGNKNSPDKGPQPDNQARPSFEEPPQNDEPLPEAGPPPLSPPSEDPDSSPKSP